MKCNKNQKLHNKLTKKHTNQFCHTYMDLMKEFWDPRLQGAQSGNVNPNVTAFPAPSNTTPRSEDTVKSGSGWFSKLSTKLSSKEVWWNTSTQKHM